MKITFIANEVSLFEAIDTDGVGFDEEYQAILTEDGDDLIWETSFSRFKYRQLGLPGSEYDLDEGQAIYIYEGAGKGFLTQNLLPNELKGRFENRSLKELPPGMEIVEVSGTYGMFKGKEALEKYNAVKEQWEAVCVASYEKFVEDFPSGADYAHCWKNGQRNGKFAAALWAVANEDSEQLTFLYREE